MINSREDELFAFLDGELSFEEAEALRDRLVVDEDLQGKLEDILSFESVVSAAAEAQPATEKIPSIKVKTAPRSQVSMSWWAAFVESARRAAANRLTPVMAASLSVIALSPIAVWIVRNPAPVFSKSKQRQASDQLPHRLQSGAPPPGDQSHR